jgi:hypothetical protein
VKHTKCAGIWLKLQLLLRATYWPLLLLEQNSEKFFSASSPVRIYINLHRDVNDESDDDEEEKDDVKFEKGGKHRSILTFHRLGAM